MTVFGSALIRHGVNDPKELPLGVVLGIVNLVDVKPTLGLEVSQKEGLFGDYGMGRFAWKLELVDVFPAPIPAKGKQGLWEWKRP